MPFDVSLPEMKAVDALGRRALAVYASYNYILKAGARPTMTALKTRVGLPEMLIRESLLLLRERFAIEVILPEPAPLSSALPPSLQPHKKPMPMAVRVWKSFHKLLRDDHRPTAEEVANDIGTSIVVARNTAALMRSRYELDFAFGSAYRAKVGEPLAKQVERLVASLNAEGHKPTAREIAIILATTPRQVHNIKHVLRRQGLTLALAPDVEHLFSRHKQPDDDARVLPPRARAARDRGDPVGTKRRKGRPRLTVGKYQGEPSLEKRQAELSAIAEFLQRRAPTKVRAGVARGLSVIPDSFIQF